MTESCVDLSELEKLSPKVNSGDKKKKETEKWQLLLEPALVGAMLAINLGQTSLQNFYLRTACTVDLGYAPSICDRGVGEEFLAVEVCHATGRDVTRNMGTHRAAIQIAHVVGAVSGPLIFRCLGFYGVFSIVFTLQVSSLAYVIFYMKDVNINSENKVSVFNLKLPYNAIHCLVRRRDGHKRATILLMLVVALGDRIILTGDVYYSYMYYRLKFHWNDILFGSFLAYKNIISFLGTLIILTVLKRRLRLSDEIVGALSSISFILATSGLIAATYTICVFLLPIIGIISQGSQVVQRPLVNKQILPTEQGKIYSVLGALESAMQTITTPLYSLLYSKTVATLPDAWLFPGMALSVLQLLAFLSTRKLRLISLKSELDKDNVELDKKTEVLPSKNIINDNHSNIILSPETVDKKNLQ